jgi:hypothetical protein
MPEPPPNRFAEWLRLNAEVAITPPDRFAKWHRLNAVVAHNCAARLARKQRRDDAVKALFRRTLMSAAIIVTLAGAGFFASYETHRRAVDPLFFATAGAFARAEHKEVASPLPTSVGDDHDRTTRP